MPKLLVATTNRKKVEELRALLPGIELETLADHPGVLPAEETGDDFATNARLKAEHASKVLGLPVIADDSGLCVDALDGAPGVKSARYAEGSDQDRVRKLLGALAHVPPDRRGAHFACAIAFAAPGRATLLVEGRVDGSIIDEARGGRGFGYDPVFRLEGDSRTLAELSLEEKNTISHRARALEAIRPTLAEFFFA